MGWYRVKEFREDGVEVDGCIMLLMKRVDFQL